MNRRWTMVGVLLGVSVCGCSSGSSDGGLTDAGNDVDASVGEDGGFDGGGHLTCASNNGGCHPSASCIDTNAGRWCRCPTGFVGDGLNCTDVDECATNNGGCSPAASCTNTPGARQCSCAPGAFGDGLRCVSLSIAAAPPALYLGAGDSAEVMVALALDGTPATSHPLAISTTLGDLTNADGGAFTSPGITDATGQVRLRLHEGGLEGVASLTAADPQGGASASTTVSFLRIGSIAHVSTTCGGRPCSLMGLRYTGVDTEATVRFVLRDTQVTPQPVRGVRVNFTLTNGPPGTVLTASGVSDNRGEVDAIINSGNVIGSTAVTAWGPTGEVATSPPIGIRGAKASNRFSELSCARVNLGAFVTSIPPLSIGVACRVRLIDRYNNPVGIPAPVRLLAEAGAAPLSVTTRPFVFPPGTDEGVAPFTFSTLGSFPPADVAPLEANSAQVPFVRSPEPTTIDGALTRNPRDGLVTLLALTLGEEDLRDDNANEVHDPGEQFIDQGEPFVDDNDNGHWDPGESFVDVPDPDAGFANGVWDGPNGVWDSRTTIWTETRVLYTGAIMPGLSLITAAPTRVDGGSYGVLAVDANVTLSIYLPDQNLNRVEAGASLDAGFSPATRGTIAVVNDTSSLDDYGFTLQRSLVDASETGPCLATTPCHWRTLFGSWSEGHLADLRLSAGPSPAMPTAQDAIVQGTVRGVTTTVTSSGTVE